MKISLAICTHNEGYYVKNLLSSLVAVIKRCPPESFEIVVVDDFSTDKVTLEAFEEFANDITLYQHALNHDFAAHKNFLSDQCSGDWILNIDADELLPEGLLDNLHLIIESNPEVEAYWLPRVNTVDGLTLDHVRKWGWVLTSLPNHDVVQNLPKDGKFYALLKAYDLIKSERDNWIEYSEPIINWPDPQMRLYKNTASIQWEGKVHERLTGFAHYSMFPHDPQFAIIHRKFIDRQEAQNTYYDTIQR